MNANISRRTVLALGAVAAGEVLLSGDGSCRPAERRVVVWSEGTAPKNVYPKDIRGAVADGLKPLKAGRSSRPPSPTRTRASPKNRSTRPTC